MNFYDNLCGIQDQDNISLTRTLAEALNRQARQILLPLYRNICVNKEWDNDENLPVPSPYLLDAVGYAFYHGRLNFIEHWEIEEIAKEFVMKLSNGSKELLAYYMHSTERAIETLNQDIESGIYEHLLDGVDEDHYLSTVFSHMMKHVKDDEILQWLQEELGNLQNFFSIDLLLHWDKDNVNHVNELFAEYLGIPYGEIELYPRKFHPYYSN